VTMLSARGVKLETIDELIEAGFAIKKSEVVGRGRSIEITRIAITDAGRRAIERPTALWACDAAIAAVMAKYNDALNARQSPNVKVSRGGGASA
jgi:hypothetical protein